MIYLIASLVAGMYFLITGKIKFGKTLYLEGKKARIVGLIFLAPLGLVLVIFGTFLVFSIVGISVSDSSIDIVDTFASSLVRNGFLIGLAYISFHSVSRETKVRGGCLSYWLVYAAAIAILLVYFFLPNIGSSSSWITSLIIGFSVLQLISIIGIWSWRKWGVFGYVVLNLIAPLITFFNTDSVLQSLVSLIQSLSLTLVLYLLAKPKWQFFE